MTSDSCSGAIAFDNVSFAYREDRLVLQDITLDVPSQAVSWRWWTYGQRQEHAQPAGWATTRSMRGEIRLTDARLPATTLRV